MSRSKRTPIDYTTQFNEGIFRPRDVVESERDAIAAESPASSAPATPERKRASKPARTRARIESHVGPLTDTLYRALQQKQRLASSTFRFQPQELEELDRITTELARTANAKLSKNDIVRLALNWLIADYKSNKEESMLGRVLERT